MWRPADNSVAWQGTHNVAANDKTVHIIHCVDAEGPLYESLDATFDRLYELFGIRLEATKDNLRKIQGRLIDFGDKTDIIAEVFAPHHLNYNDTWEKIDAMLCRIMAPEFRNALTDSFGRGWVYNWHCVDHVGYIDNPRRRDMGIHKVFDHYNAVIKEAGSCQDSVHWHFHPMSIYREAHRCATSFINSPHLYEILCRRVIERQWFPAVFRAGFQAERPDSHWFLEQWIPFDASNWAYREDDGVHDHQADIAGGRSGDWRLAPDDWSVYQPSHDNYQLPGNCRRWICRALDIRTRARELTQAEVDKAFARASKGQPTIMGITDHDFRDIASDVEFVREKIRTAAEKFPDVKFKFCEAVEGFRSAIYGPQAQYEPVKLAIRLEGNDERRFLEVETAAGKAFGPQPFLAVKTRSGRFIHDNFDFDTTLTKWSYTFDYDSIRADDISAVGVATNDAYGNTFVQVIRP